MAIPVGVPDQPEQYLITVIMAMSGSTRRIGLQAAGFLTGAGGRGGSGR